MKKVDSATGMTIEVPSIEAKPRSDYPYPGFWTAAQPRLVNALKEHGESLRYENNNNISDALNALIELANGEFAVVLSERIWYIGALLNENSTIPVKGRAGSALGYIRESSDGGRMAIAARVFEKPIRAILDHGSGATTAGAQLSNLMNEHNNSHNQLQKLTNQLHKIESEAPSRSVVKAKYDQCVAYASELDRATELVAQSVAHLQQLQQLNNH